MATLTPEEWRGRRGRELAMVFQEPMTSLNPAFTAGEQVAEVLRLHEGMGEPPPSTAAIALLDRVRIPEAARRARQYPHQLSGGMRQRVMIAMALACKPRLLIADEPTTALDVTVQAQILALLDELKRETGTAIVLITHDLGVVADHADDVVVMYAGRVAERAKAATLFARPEHPYTVGLLGAAPRIEGGAGRLASIEGTVPDLLHPPEGCRFAPRCPFRAADCARQPPLAEVAPGPCQRLLARAARPGAGGMSEALLELGALRKHFPVRDMLGRSRGAVRAVDGVSLTRAARQRAGHRRRERLRQVDARPPGAAADRAGCGQHPLRGRGSAGAVRRRRCGRGGGRCSSSSRTPSPASIRA